MQSNISKGLSLTLSSFMFVMIASSLSAADTSASAATFVTTPVEASAPQPASDYGVWGLDLTARDPNVRPGADFYSYANGHWLKSNTIPSDRVNWGGFSALAVDAEKKVQGIIQTLPVQAPADSLQQKIGDYYRAYLDVAQIEHEGLAPAQPILKAIEAATTHEDVATLMGRPDLQLDSPIGFSIAIDDKNPDRYIVSIGQSGLGLPQREYYLSKDPKFVQIRAQYLAHIERMLTLLGDADAAAAAKDVLALETQIAEAHWPIEKQRERDLTYNQRVRDALSPAAPKFPWQAFLGAAGVAGEKEYVVAEVDAVDRLAKQFTQVPVVSWKRYLKYHFLVSKAGVMPKAFDEERFAFYGKTLNGQPQQRARWKRAVQSVDNALGEAVGQLYVQQYFPADAKAQMLTLVENLRAAYMERILAAAWMTPETRQQALKKLATFRPKIAYPDKWRDYSALHVKPADAFGNLARSSVFDWQRQLQRLHQPTDRDEWDLTPQTVNAYYNPTFNEIVFPAAILQPPFFDPKADPAVNYGGIGAVIGHEMSHGFDDQGAKYDERGVLRSWWRTEDEAAFKALGDKVAAQYCAVLADGGFEAQRPSDPGRKLGRSEWSHGCLRCLPPVIARPGCETARWLERGSTLFPIVCAGLAELGPGGESADPSHE